MTARNIEDIYELTPLQHGMLFQGLLAPEDGTYIEQTVLSTGGQLDPEAFWGAWQLIVDRHGALRTTFHWDRTSKPVQVVHAGVSLPRDEADWRGLTAQEQEYRLAAELAEERRLGFDAAARPPMRIRLYRTGEDDYRISLGFSHLILDGWSVGVIMSEFITAYRALRHGRHPDLPPAGRYRDYVAWWKRGDATRVSGFWRGRLGGYQAAPRLDCGDPAATGLPYGWHEVSLADLGPDVRAFSARHRLTAHTLTQAAWTLVLARGLDRQDLVVGTTMAHRPPGLPSAESIVGCLLVTLPVRTMVTGDRAVLDWLHEIQDTITAGREHARADQNDFRRWSEVPPSGDLFESIVTFQNMPMPAMTLGSEGMELRGVAMDTRPHLPLSLMVLPGGDMPMRLVYDRRRVSSGQAVSLLEQTRAALTSLVRDRAATLAEVSTCPPGGGHDVATPLCRAPEPGAPEPTLARTVPGEPVTETERALATLMAELLGLPSVGGHQNLVDLGLHSLLGTRAANRIRDQWHTAVPLRALFEQPTVAQLAALIEAGGVPESAATQAVGLDLPAEVARYDPGAAAPPSRAADAPGRILITGATGYLGTQLLAELLQTTTVPVTCLVRAPQSDVAAQRVRDALAAAGRWDDAFAGRVEALPANLAQPGLGLDEAQYRRLAEEAGAVYHLAAVVNTLPPYRRLRAANVGGMAEILRLAATGGLRVHCISPAELTEQPDAARAGREVALPDELPGLHNGYSQSKWVAERLAALAACRGTAVTVYRAARLTGSPHTPRWKFGDVMTELTRACVSLGKVPDDPVQVPVSPVDYVAAAMARLSAQDASAGYFHLIAARPFGFGDLAAAMETLGYQVRLVGLATWYAELVRLAQRDRTSGWDLVLSVVGPWVRAVQDGWSEPAYETAAARLALGADLPEPELDAAALAQCLTQMARIGFIPSGRAMAAS